MPRGSILTVSHVVVPGHRLQVVIIRTPVQLHEWLRSANLTQFLAREPVPAHSEQVDAAVLRTDSDHVVG